MEESQERRGSFRRMERIKENTKEESMTEPEPPKEPANAEGISGSDTDGKGKDGKGE